jgi:hypothetical protein
MDFEAAMEKASYNMKPVLILPQHKNLQSILVPALDIE